MFVGPETLEVLSADGSRSVTGDRDVRVEGSLVLVAAGRNPDTAGIAAMLQLAMASGNPE